MLRVLIRVDASKNIGFGHLERCLVLAEVIKSSGGTCAFVCQKLAGDGVEKVSSRGFKCYENQSLSNRGVNECNQLSTHGF